MALQVVQRSSFFKEYYEHKKKGFVRPLEKKEALCAVILKLVRVLFALMRDRRPFTEKMDRCQEGAPSFFVGIKACTIQLGQLPPTPLICIR